MAAIRELAEDGLTAAQEGIDRFELYGATNWLSTSGYVVHEAERSQFGYTAPYAPDVDKGTPPHVVDLDDLTEWARIKFGLSPAEARSRAAAVQRAIAQHGTRPKPFWSNAVERVRARLPSRVSAKAQEKLSTFKVPR